MEDIRNTGTGGLDGLKGINKKSAAQQYIDDFDSRYEEGARQLSPDTILNDYRVSPAQSIGLRLANSGYGESSYDENAQYLSQLDNLGDIRAESQPWINKIGAGLAKGAVLAGTTFLDGTIGLVTGIGTVINEGRMSGLWDNDFSRAMQSVNETIEKELPNYYSQEEQNSPWYSPTNVFSANFIGDKFIKNLGFTIGAFYSGGLEAGLVRGLGSLATKGIVKGATKLGKTAQAIEDIAKMSDKTTKMVASGVGSAISAVNEGRIEALNNSKDWYELNKAQLDDEYNARIQAILDTYGGTEMEFALLAQEEDNYKASLSRLNEDRAKMGNADMIMNLPILLASNIYQFGKLYANGFKTAKSNLNILGRPGEYTSGTSMAKVSAKAIGNALSEGVEEISQKAASVTAGNYYTKDLNNFYKALKDPDAEQETVDWIRELGLGINETVNDGSSWEEFFIGTLTGALGMPRFRSVRNSDGKFQSPVALEGGIYGEIRDGMEQMAREKEIVDQMNERVQSPEFLNYYQGLIRHKKYQNDMDRAVLDDNEFDFKNAEHAQLISDITMFDKAGKLGDLQEMINSAFDTSDENLESIIKNTTTKNEDGTLTGPFANYATVDSEGNITASFGSEDNKTQMIKKLTENKKEFDDTINSYRAKKDEIIRTSNHLISGEGLEELTWIGTQLDNWDKRGVEIAESLKPTLTNVIHLLNARLRFNQSLRDSEGQSHADLSEDYKRADNNIRILEGNIKQLTTLRDMESEAMSRIIKESPEFVKDIIKEIDRLEDDILDAQGKSDVKNKLNDMVKLGKAIDSYRTKFIEYMLNPDKQLRDHVNADNQAIQNNRKKQASDTAQQIRDTEVPDLVAQYENGEFDESMLAALEEDENSDAQDKLNNAKNIAEAKQQIHARIDNSDMTNSQKKAAHQMLDKSSQSANDLAELLNTESAAFFDTEGTLDLDNEEQAEIQAAWDKDPELGKQILAQKMQENDEEARAELQAIFNDWERNKAELEELKTGDNELAEAMNSSQEELQSAMDKRKQEGETGADPAGKVPAIQPVAESTKEERTITTESDGKFNSTQDIVTQESTIDDTEQEKSGPKEKQVLPKSNGGQPLYWKSNTTQEVTAQTEERLGLSVGHHITYHNSGLDKNATKHEIIWNYLNDNGAFARMNKGLVHQGSKVRVGFDKTLNEQVGAVVPLLYVEDPENKGNYVLVGDMISSIDDYHKVFPNYQPFLTRITEFANKSTENQGVTPIELTVKDMLLGRPNYSSPEDRRTLNEIANGRKFKLAVATKNPSVMIVDSKKITRASRTPIENNIKVPLTQSPGQPFILVGDGVNKYMCVPIRLPKFDIATAKDSALGRHILKIAKDLNNLDELSLNEITLLKDDLQAVFNFEHLWIHKSKESGNWIITYKTPSMPSTKFLSYNDKAVDTTTGEINIANRVLSQFTRDGVGFQVDLYKMNTNEKIDGVPYNEAIGELATTNLEVGGLELINNFPIFNYQDESGKDITATTPSSNYDSSDPEAVSKAEQVMTTLENQKIDRPTTTDNTYGVNGVKYERVHTVMGNNSKTEMTPQGKLNGDRAKAAGTEIDNIVRQFFEITNDDYNRDKKGALAKIDYNKSIVSEVAFNQLVNQLDSFRNYFNKANRYRKWEKVYANNIVVAHDFNGTKVAGEIDLVTIDDKGNFRIYDMKTSKNSFASDSYDNPKSYQIRSDREEHSRQLNFYADMLEKEYGVKVVSLNIMPINVRFNNGNNAIAHSTDPVVDANILPFIPLDRSTTSTQEAIDNYNKSKNSKPSTSEPTKKSSYQEHYDSAVKYLEKKNSTLMANGAGVVSLMNYANKYIRGLMEDVEKAKKDLSEHPDSEWRKALLEAKEETLEAWQDARDAIVTKAAKRANVTITLPPRQESKSILDAPKEVQDAINSLAGYFEGGGLTIKDDFPNVTDEQVDALSDYFVANIPLSLDMSNKIYTVVSKPKAQPSSEEGQSLVRQNILDSLGDNSAFTDYEENRDIVEMLTDSQLEQLQNMNRGPKTKRTWQGFINMIDRSKPLDAKTIREAFDTALNTKFSLVEESDINVPKWNEQSRKRELRRIARMLPQLSPKERIRVLSKIEDIAGKGNPHAWGKYVSGIITLYENAIVGTGYHEAFHYVIDGLLDSREKSRLFALGRMEYGAKSIDDLEENLADGFKEYCILRDDASIGQKLKNFFRDLWIDIKNFFGAKDNLNAIYSRVYRGKYADRTENTRTMSNRVKYQAEEKKLNDILAKAPRDPDTKKLLVRNREGKLVESNLTERQYAQVRTDEFKAWFGDWENDPENASKVVDENGEPLVVYHGNRTDSIINSFDVNKIGSEHKNQFNNIKGFWFSTEKRIAKNEYALKPESVGRGVRYLEYGEVLPVFLNVRSPKVATQKGIQFHNSLYGSYNTREEQTDEFWKRVDSEFSKENDGLDLTFIDSDNDADSFESIQRQLIVTDPNQIKSATDNIGTFDSNSPDIRYSRVSDGYIKSKLSRMSYYDVNAQGFNNKKYSKQRRLSEIGKMNDAISKNMFDGLDIRPYHLNSKGLIERYPDETIIRAFRNREYPKSNNQYGLDSNNKILKDFKAVGVVFNNSMIDNFYKSVNTNNPYHLVFKQMIDILNKNNVPINVKADFNHEHIASYNLNGFRKAEITFNPRKLSDYVANFNRSQYKSAVMQVLTHELVHTTTAEILNSDSDYLKDRGFDSAKIKFNEDISRIFNHAKKYIGDEGWYGMKDTKEFVAEAFTNPRFQQKLASIPNSNKEGDNIFTRFINAITNLFNNYFKSYGINIENSALEEVISVSQEYFDFVSNGFLREDDFFEIDDFSSIPDDISIPFKSDDRRNFYNEASHDLLVNKGFNEESWNNLTKEQQDYTLDCIGVTL